MDTIFGIEPTEFTFTVLAFMVAVTLIYFFTRQFWPWYTKTWWPARQELSRTKTEREFKLRADKEKAEMDMEIERQKQQYEIQMKSLEIQQNIRDALVELKTLVSQNTDSLSRLETSLNNGMENRLRSVENDVMMREK
jgi:predicted membrane protein